MSGSRHVARTASGGQRGFSVLELVVALAVLALVLVAMLGLFDMTNKVARVETHVSELQQSLRIGHNEMVRMVRMTARGWTIGPPGSTWPAAGQVSVIDNVGNATFIDGSSTAELKVLPGTDILRIRGVINNPLFLADLPAGMFFEQSLEISELSDSRTKQELDTLDDMPAGSTLLVVSRLGDIAFVPATRIGSGTKDKRFGAEIFTVDFVELSYDTPVGTPAWVTATPARPIALAGELEDYAFYIRENDGRPRLSMARFDPGTTNAYLNDPANLRQDIADEIYDLQVALGIDEYVDSNANGAIEPSERDGDKIVTDAGSADDEWIGNHAGDGALPAIGTDADLFYVRITTLGRTEGRDFQYISEPIAAIENHVYNEPAAPTTDAERVERGHRRRVMRTVVDLRNL